MKPFRTQGKAGIALAVATTLLLSACGDQPPPATPQTGKLFEQQREALEKSKQVEQAAAQRAEELKREEEKQTQ